MTHQKCKETGHTRKALLAPLSVGLAVRQPVEGNGRRSRPPREMQKGYIPYKEGRLFWNVRILETLLFFPIKTRKNTALQLGGQSQHSRLRVP